MDFKDQIGTKKLNYQPLKLKYKVKDFIPDIIIELKKLRPTK